MGKFTFCQLLAWAASRSCSFAWSRYQMIKSLKNAEKMHESIRGIAAQKLDTLTFDGPIRMYTRFDKVDFAANTEIPGFDKIISAIRSREVQKFDIKIHQRYQELPRAES